MSVNTVSRAINGTNREVWPSIARRAGEIRRIAKQMGYRPNAAARAMRAVRSQHIGIIMSGGHAAPYEFPVITGVNQRLQAAGYAISIVSTSESGSRTPQEALVLREQFLAGALVMHVPRAVCQYALSVLPHCIHIDSNIREPECCIYRDEHHAGRIAAEHMIKLGYARLLLIGHKPWEDAHVHALERARGVCEAAAAAGIPLERIEFGFPPEEFRAAAPRLLEKLAPETGVIASGESLAEWCAHVANDAGLCPGTDFGLASCSETQRSKTVWPGLSRMSFDRVGLGRRAADMMLSILEDSPPQRASVAIRGEWIPGDTARPQG